MKHKAKTYRQFINEAYIDDSGELQDLQFTPEEESKLALYDELNVISDFLEDSGATSIRMDRRKEDDGIYRFSFEFEGNRYELNIDISSSNREEHRIILLGNVDNWRSSPIVIYDDSAYSFFDLLSGTGLDFLRL
jgi:hypothetical protein